MDSRSCSKRRDLNSGLDSFPTFFKEMHAGKLHEYQSDLVFDFRLFFLLSEFSSN
jgi:hypothetical protein